MSQIKLMVFDMDGVIVDTEPLHRKAKEQVLVDYGIENDVNLDATVGLPNEAFWAKIIKEYSLMAEPDDLVLLQNNLILSMMEKLGMGLTPGLPELLDELESRDIKIGLASSSRRYFVEKVLNRYGVKNRFTYTVTGDEVEKRKPEPECYKKVLTLAGVEPSEAAAIEDSTAGVKAACTAGLLCFGFNNPGSGNQDLSLSHHKIARLTDVVSFLFG